MPARAMVSHLARVTASSRAMETTTRALGAAPAPTTREVMAAMVNLSQVEEDSVDSITASKTLYFSQTLTCSYHELFLFLDFLQEDMALSRLTRPVVGIIIPASRTALEDTTAAASRPA